MSDQLYEENPSFRKPTSLVSRGRVERALR